MLRISVFLFSIWSAYSCSSETDFASKSSGGDQIVVADQAEDARSREIIPVDEYKIAEGKLCLSKPLILRAGESTAFKWKQISGADALQVILKADDESYAGSLGQVQVISANEALYTAPASISKAVRILASADPAVAKAACSVSLLAEADLGVEDDGFVNGLIGRVYQLQPNIGQLPDFSPMQVKSTIAVPNLDIPMRNFTTGFPGVTDLFEWFGVRFDGRLEIAAEADYEFRLTSDDGAILYLDGAKVVDNDGLHPTISVDGVVHLSAGFHNIRVDYYQGPRTEIALQLEWRKAGIADPFVIVPAEVLSRPN